MTQLDTKMPGRVTEVAANLYSLRLPMPLELDHINAYLIRENNRLALVDTGLDLPDSWEALTRAFSSLDLGFDELTDIFVTHAHPDHIGQLSRLRQLAPQARLFLHQIEYDRLIRRVDRAAMEQSFQGWLDRHGMTDMNARRLFESGMEVPPDLRPGDMLVEGGEHIRLDDPLTSLSQPTDPTAEWEIIWTPGHTAGHFVLYSRERGLLLSGDHLLTSISSNIGKYPGSTADPLGDFISSLESIAQLDLNTILPAHGQPFGNYRERITHLIGHHKHRLDKIHATLEHGPRTAAEVVHAIWGERVKGFHRYLALVEALSHLERLHLEGRVTTEEDKGILRYRAA